MLSGIIDKAKSQHENEPTGSVSVTLNDEEVKVLKADTSGKIQWFIPYVEGNSLVGQILMDDYGFVIILTQEENDE